jgi:uncharacterized membrane protein
MWPTRPQDRRTTRIIFLWLLSAFFIFSGLNHFRMPAIYVSMIPPWLPKPEALNLAAGTCEVLGGIGVLMPRLRIAAGWGLIALLVAVFPANLHVALMGHMPGFGFSTLGLWLRLPFQGVLVAWVAWVTLTAERNP